MSDVCLLLPFAAAAGSSRALPETKYKRDAMLRNRNCHSVCSVIRHFRSPNLKCITSSSQRTGIDFYWPIIRLVRSQGRLNRVNSAYGLKLKKNIVIHSLKNMADQSVEDYLRSWGLQMYIEIFKEQAIDLSALQVLTQDNINDLIPIIGHRAIFTAQLKVLRDVINNTYSSTPEPPLSSKNVRDEYTPDSNSASTSYSNLLDNSNICILPYEDPQCDLHQLLESSNEGKGLLLNFKESGLLDNAARRRLCNLIINNELKDDPDKKVTSPQFYQLAYKISQIFKKESPSVYFIPYACFRPQQKTSAKGKLLDCYRQRRREFLKSGVIKTKLRRTSASSSVSSNPASPLPHSSRVQEAANQLQNSINETNVEEALLWLQNSTDPWLNVELHWDQTAKARFTKFSSSSMTISSYFNEFKALSQAGGLYLLLRDFSVLYPEHDGKLFEDWPLHRQKILQLAKKRNDPTLIEILSCIDGADEDVLNMAAFMSLPFLMSTTTIRKSRAKRQWRPSKLEVLQGFITHVKSAAELEESITRRKEKLAGLGLTLQPYIMLVGPSIKEIHSRYIIINNVKYTPTQDVRYNLTSISHAVDACFKILFVLNAEYSTESAHVWCFIQKAIFKLNTDYDKVYTTVNSLMSDLGIELSK